MKNFSFYKLINNLYTMSYTSYTKHLEKNIFSQDWFKKACKEKKIKIKYLSENIFIENKKNTYLLYKDHTLFFSKSLAIKFEYIPLEDDKHLKLLNINIKNETIYNISTLLLSLQKKFSLTHHYQDINIIERETFIEKYMSKFKMYLDKSILTKVLNNTTLLANDNTIFLNHLIPKKSFILSLFIKDIVNDKNKNLKSDNDIKIILEKQYKVNISRREVCRIRNKYLIARPYKNRYNNIHLYFDKYYTNKQLLCKDNLKNLENNIKGIYELSGENIEKYPYSKNKIIYIGSSINIKKRLFSYTSKDGHTNDIKKYFQDNSKIYFRIIKTSDYKKLEMLLLNSFIKVNGTLPKLNKQRVLKP